MRSALKVIENQRSKFSGTFDRFGKKTNYHGYPEPTVLLVDVMDASGNIVTDHLWFNYTKGIKDLGGLRVGDVIQFRARVKQYKKGYRGYREDAELENPPRIDYRLSHPTNFMIVKRGSGDLSSVPNFNIGLTDMIVGEPAFKTSKVDQQAGLNKFM